MSNKTRLQTNNANLQALIAKANALPEASSSGGGGVETYTLKVESDGVAQLGSLEYVAYENNEYKHYFRSFYGSTLQYPFYVENVVLNTPMIVYATGGVVSCVGLVSNIRYVPHTDYSSGMTGNIYDTNRLFPLETDADGYVVIRCYDDD